MKSKQIPQSDRDATSKFQLNACEYNYMNVLKVDIFVNIYDISWPWPHYTLLTYIELLLKVFCVYACMVLCSKDTN